MNQEHETIEAYNNLLYERYREHELVCLSDNEYQYKGENILAVNTPAVVVAFKAGVLSRLKDVCEEAALEHFQINPNISQSELITATADLKYRLGTLYLYQPYIVSLSNSYHYYGGKRHYYYNQTREDARFNRELPIAFECLYKFWQRLGDYLTGFFPELLLDRKGITYFHTPINYISKNQDQLESSENYKWLKEFAETTYPDFNNHRKFFVHHAGYDNQFFWKFLNSNQADPSAIKELDLERQNWTSYLKRQLDYCNEGYLKLMHFLNELNIEVNNGVFKYDLKLP